MHAFHVSQKMSMSHKKLARIPVLGNTIGYCVKKEKFWDTPSDV